MEYIKGDWVYDIETYPNIFTFTIIGADGRFMKTFEISDRKSEQAGFLACLKYLIQNKQTLVGFNNTGFDYPVIHEIILKAIAAKEKNVEFRITAQEIYKIAQRQIASFKGDFGNTISAKDSYIRQRDLFKINHFDNKAKSTSLKMLEFNMKSDNIEDLPFPLRKLTESEMDVLVKYNQHDVKETLKFYHKCYNAIVFRENLGEKLGIDLTNHNDTKIGKDFFIQKLESEKKGTCYTYVGKTRVLNRTVRSSIDIGDCLFDYYNFETKEFNAVKDWFSKQVITETKGVFTDIPEHELGELAKYCDLLLKRKKFKGKPTDEEVQEFKKHYPLGEVVTEDLKATEWLFDSDGNHVYEYPLDEFGEEDRTKKPKKVRVNKKSYWMQWKVAATLNVRMGDFVFDFGVGGIHGSVEAQHVKAEDHEEIKDADVSSMYPNLAIKNRIYPEHLGETFCDIYEDVYVQRQSYAKGTAENLVMKLALNGVYGDSNNEYSPFYDPKYTMTVTINGQLSILLLSEKLLKIPTLQIIQVNTDGVTVKLDKKYVDQYNKVCKEWQEITKLDLEFADYLDMYIRDVNNYIAVYTNGKVKRKGAYQYEDLGWHQNHSALVIPKAVEAYFLKGTPIRDFITNHTDKYDFMLRTKVPKSSRLVMVYEDGAEVPLQNICRYYPSKKGGKLVKIMPPTESQVAEGNTEERRIGIDKLWNVKCCNNIHDFTNDVDYDYYIIEAEKLASLKYQENEEND